MTIKCLMSDVKPHPHLNHTVCSYWSNPALMADLSQALTVLEFGPYQIFPGELLWLTMCVAALTGAQGEQYTPLWRQGRDSEYAVHTIVKAGTWQWWSTVRAVHTSVKAGTCQWWSFSESCFCQAGLLALVVLFLGGHYDVLQPEMVQDTRQIKTDKTASTDFSLSPFLISPSPSLSFTLSLSPFLSFFRSLTETPF